ncbi:predicted protein [Histoplasma mississippiense (nom. inval.)]|uniref:predicted protein n=1 Tax=Ajellomyces capsulatus (strain NAm1 / WU24) TaxID=2059318 RepID=UPI000157C3E6|nr:predicted protein [Histoplasma mississippiense (nom. inval.)]EDN07524.1 predicted protein [Histoplasma mississippiense (nom. inval.)]
MATCVGGNLNVTGLHVSVRVGCHHKTICSRTRRTQTRWMSNPSKERINPLDPNPLDESINPLDVEPVGPNPLDVKPVGRQTRWTSNPYQERINPLEVEHAGTQTRWMSNPLDEEVEQAGPNPLDVKPVQGAH